MKIEISIDSNHLSIRGEEDLLADFSKQLEADPAFQLRRPLLIERTIDPTILVALVGAFGTVLGALISGLLQIAQATAAKKIVIQLENGRKLEVPADISLADLDRLIERLKQPTEKPIRILVP